MNKLFLKAVLALSFVGQVSALPTVAQVRAGASNFGGYVSHKATQAGSFVSTPVAKQWNKLSKDVKTGVKATVGVVVLAGAVIGGRSAWSKRREKPAGGSVRADAAPLTTLFFGDDSSYVGATSPVCNRGTLSGRNEGVGSEGQVVNGSTYRWGSELLEHDIVELEPVEQGRELTEGADRVAELEGLAEVVVAEIAEEAVIAPGRISTNRKNLGGYRSLAVSAACDTQSGSSGSSVGQRSSLSPLQMGVDGRPVVYSPISPSQITPTRVSHYRNEGVSSEGQVVNTSIYRWDAELLEQDIVELEPVGQGRELAETANGSDRLAEVVVAEIAEEAVIGSGQDIVEPEPVEQGRELVEEAVLDREFGVRRVLPGEDSRSLEGLQATLTQERTSVAEILSRNCKRGLEFFNSIKLVALDMENVEADRFRGQADLIIQDESDSRSSLETDLTLSNVLNLARGVRLTGNLCDKSERRYTPDQQALIAEAVKQVANPLLNSEEDTRSRKQKRKDKKQEATAAR